MSKRAKKSKRFGAFGEPVPPETKQARGDLLMQKLYRHVGRRQTGLPTEAEYF